MHAPVTPAKNLCDPPLTWDRLCGFAYDFMHPFDCVEPPEPSSELQKDDVARTTYSDYPTRRNDDHCHDDNSPTTTWGLRRSPLNLCSGTASTTLRPQLRDFRRSPLDLCSGTASTTLRPQLGDFASQLHATGDSHTIGIFFLVYTLLQGSYLAFQQARGLHRYDAPAGASRIACTTIGFST